MDFAHKMFQILSKDLLEYTLFTNHERLLETFKTGMEGSKLG